MANIAAEPQIASAAAPAEIRWDLSRLGSAEEVKAGITRGLEEASQLAGRYRDCVASLSAPELAEALRTYDALEERMATLFSYAELRQSAELDDPEAADLVAWQELRSVEFDALIRPLMHEWVALDDEKAETILADPAVAAYRHFLEVERRSRPHILPLAEENILAERDPVVSAWQELHEKTLASIETSFNGKPTSFEELFSYGSSPDRTIRRAALDLAFREVSPFQQTLAACYDALVADRLMLDRIRRYGTDPMSATHLDNELSREIVEPMLTLVEEAYPIAQGWFKHKADLFGLERIALADQYAPFAENVTVPWAQGEELAREIFAGLSHEAGASTASMFAERRIDAAPRAGKSGGAYCSTPSRQAGSWVLMSYTGSGMDVFTLVHELGHALAAALAGQHQPFACSDTGDAIGEVPSLFSEILLFDRLCADDADPALRREAARILVDSACSAIFRQVVLTRFEQRAYAARAGGQALTAERLSDIWMEENHRYYGDSVDLPEGYRTGWSYIPHFINGAFYNYSYVFAFLVALTLYALYREGKAAFTERYLTFLCTGGSASPEALLRPFGIDLNDPQVFAKGLAELEQLVVLAKR